MSVSLLMRYHYLSCGECYTARAIERSPVAITGSELDPWQVCSGIGLLGGERTMSLTHGGHIMLRNICAIFAIPIATTNADPITACGCSS